MPFSSGWLVGSGRAVAGSENAANRGQTSGEGGPGGASRGEGGGDPSAPSSWLMQEESLGDSSFLRFRALVTLGEVTRRLLLMARTSVGAVAAACPSGARPSAPSVALAAGAPLVPETAAVAATWA